MQEEKRLEVLDEAIARGIADAEGGRISRIEDVRARLEERLVITPNDCCHHSSGGRADLAGIQDCIAQRNPERAITFLTELLDRCESLAMMASSFPLVPRYERHGIRRRPHGNYLIFYRIVDEFVVVTPKMSASSTAHGYLKLVDRIKDVIRTGGEWVSSIELESIISQHPGVAEVAVIGMPDAKWGERPAAVVVARTAGDVDEADIEDQVSRQAERGLVSKYAVPERVYFVDSLPKTSVGKLNKKALRQSLSDTPATP
jgi:plasmid stabilization system protein ParE